MAAERCSAWEEEMTASLADSEGMTMLKTGSSVSGKIDLGTEEGKIGEEELSSTKSGVPPNSTSSDGGKCFPLPHDVGKKEKAQRRRFCWEAGTEWIPLWNSLLGILEEAQE